MKNRILALDVCRGFLLFVMTFNHLLAFPFISAEALYKWDVNVVYGKFGFLSNSEGFFFLAGLTAGIVYGRLILQERGSEVAGRIWKRIRQMYGIYALLLAGVALLVVFNRDYLANWKMLHKLIWVWIDQPGIHYFLDHPYTGFIMGLAFLYQLPFFDLFATYMILFALTPWLLSQLNKKRAVPLLAASVFCYLASQFDPGFLERAFQTFLPAKLSWFHLGSIQILFVSGLTLGFLYADGRMPNIHKVFGGTLLLLSLIFACMYLIGADMQNFRNLSILRLTVFCFKGYAAFLARRFLTFQPLALIGKYALTVFSYHIALVFALVLFLSEIAALSLPFKLVCLSASLASIWIPVYVQAFSSGIKRSLPV